MRRALRPSGRGGRARRRAWSSRTRGRASLVRARRSSPSPRATRAVRAWGLAICQEIVQAQGGRIALHNRLQDGAWPAWTWGIELLLDRRACLTHTHGERTGDLERLRIDSGCGRAFYKTRSLAVEEHKGRVLVNGHRWRRELARATCASPAGARGGGARSATAAAAPLVAQLLYEETRRAWPGGRGRRGAVRMGTEPALT